MGCPTGQTGAISAASLVNLVPDDVYDAWITLAKADSGMKAVPATAPQDTGLDLKAFQNLGYTGEWFVFAGFVVFMWFRLLRREVEFVRDAELGLVRGRRATPATRSRPPSPASRAGLPATHAARDGPARRAPRTAAHRHMTADDSGRRESPQRQRQRSGRRQQPRAVHRARAGVGHRGRG